MRWGKNAKFRDQRMVIAVMKVDQSHNSEYDRIQSNPWFELERLQMKGVHFEYMPLRVRVLWPTDRLSAGSRVRNR